MRQLESEDVYWISRRLPHPLWKLMVENKGKLFVAGGFVRACIAHEEVNDIDLFTSSLDEARRMGTHLVAHGKGLQMIETDNAFTVLGYGVPIQFIHRWTFEAPEKCVESFDFTIARAAVWIGADKDAIKHPTLSSVCDDRFYSDLAAKRLVYCVPVRNEDAGGSMLRVLKFYQRGYRIPLDSLGAVIARLSVAVDANRIEPVEGAPQMTAEQRTAFVITGLLREVDPNIDPNHLAHHPSIRSPQ